METSPEDNKPHKEKKGKKRKGETSSETKDKKKKKKRKKQKYSSSKWTSSSSESEYESLCHINQLAVASLPKDAERDEVIKFFNGKPVQVKVGNQLNEKREFVDRQALVVFGSRSETKEGLKLNGPIYVARRGNSREIMCVSGFNNQVPVDTIKKELGQNFRERGKLLNIFLPVDSTTSLGFGYIYIDLEGKGHMEKAFKNLIQYTKIGGVKVHIRRAKPKLCYRAEMEGNQQTVQGSVEDEEKIALKKMLLPITVNLHTSVETQKRSNWKKDRPEVIPEAPLQDSSECWALGLHRGHSAARILSGIDGPVPTVKQILEGVDVAHQVSGEGINRLRNACNFMESCCKEMKIHRRPRGDDVTLFEDFEKFIINLLAKTPVMVTVECVPGFIDDFDGQGIYRPSDIDCYLKTFEKFPTHCLFLMDHNVENGIEFWELQESRGKKYGNDGCIRMERHKCLIKSVVEFKF